MLFGGKGSDTFVFAPVASDGLPGGNDTITDFVHGQDKIDLSSFHIEITDLFGHVNNSHHGAQTLLSSKGGNFDVYADHQSQRDQVTIGSGASQLNETADTFWFGNQYNGQSSQPNNFENANWFEANHHRDELGLSDCEQDQSPIAIHSDGTNTVLAFDGGSITIQNVTELHQNDFIV